MSARWLITVATFAWVGCAFDATVSPTTPVSCGSQADCPTGFRCVGAIGRCVSVENPDVTPPGLAGQATLSPSVARAGQLVELAFRVDEPLAALPTLQLQFSDGTLSPELAVTGLPGASDEYRAQWPATGQEPEGAVRALARLLDLDGNEAGRVDLGAFLLDFTAPHVVLGSETLTLTAGPSSPLATVTALGTASSATIGFTVSEPLRAPPTLTAEADGAEVPLAFVFSLGATVTSAWTVSVPDAGVAQGPMAVFARLEDLAGNVTRQPVALPAPGLIVDTQPPPAPRTADGGVRLERAPWGSAAAGDTAAAWLRADDGTLEAGALVLVTERDPSREVTRVQASDAGGFALQVPLTQLALALTAVDAAGNRSAPAPVTGGALVLALGATGTVNPNRFESRERLGPALLQGDATARDAASGVTQHGGLALSTTGAWSWRARPKQGPTAALAAPFAWDEAAATALSLGGARGGAPVVGAAWRWSGEAWAPVTTTDPEGDGNPVATAGSGVARSAAHDPNRRETLLVVDAAGALETWAWDGRSWARRARTTQGPGCGACQLAWSEPLSRVLLVEHPPAGAVQLHAWQPATAQWARLDGGLGAPSARPGAAVAVDERAGRLVLLGGLTDAGLSDELWSWAPAGWTRHAVDAGPGPATDRAATWDVARGRVAFAGGFAPGADGGLAGLDESWEWDGTRFERAATTTSGAALPVGGGSMVFDRARGERVLIGGADTPGALPQDGTWGWRQGIGWRRLSSPGAPPARSGHAAAFEPASGRTFLFGGRTDDAFVNAYRDLWAWDGAGWVWVDALLPGPVGPDARFRAALVARGTTGELVLTGGVGVGLTCLGDAWRLQGERWAALAAGGDARCGHVSTWNRATDEVLVAGGASAALDTQGGTEAPGQPVGSTQRLQLDGGWAAEDAGTFARYGAAFASSPATGELLAHGGLTAGATSRETWRWQAGRWTQVASTGPAVAHGALARDARTGAWLLFGGAAPAESAELWAWDGTSWTRPPLADPEGDGAPPARSRASFTFDGQRDVGLLFGGLAAGAVRDDTWELSTGGRPAHVLRAPLSSLGAPLPQVRAVEVRGVAGGSGRSLGAASPGVEVLWWLDGAWRAATPTVGSDGLPHGAAQGAPAAFRARLDDAALLALLTLRPELAIAVVPRGENEAALARLLVDQLEVQVEYELR